MSKLAGFLIVLSILHVEAFAAALAQNPQNRLLELVL